MTGDRMIVEGFHGPGGWAEGRRLLAMDAPAVGLELDEAACRTAAAAGHSIIRCDVTQYPTSPFKGRTWGKVDSPPCPTFSRSGNGAGARDLPYVQQAIDDLAHGRDTRCVLRAACCDERSMLTAEPMRWHYDLRPEWIAMEQVPAVLPVWRQYALVLRGWGYSVWCGELNAADYGVPQSRRRAVLIASRVQAVTAPVPTHVQHPQGNDLFGESVPRWISMAEALGWGYTQRPSPAVTGEGTYTGGPEPFSSTSRAAMRAAMANPDHWAWKRPAPTVTGTVGHVGGKQVGGHLNLECEEAAVLQTFRRDHPFQGKKGQRSLQIGNAVPPRFAAHVQAAASGVPFRQELEIAA